jgi:hypothetical protein
MCSTTYLLTTAATGLTCPPQTHNLHHAADSLSAPTRLQLIQLPACVRCETAPCTVGVIPVCHPPSHWVWGGEIREVYEATGKPLLTRVALKQSAHSQYVRGIMFRQAYSGFEDWGTPPPVVGRDANQPPDSTTSVSSSMYILCSKGT